MTAIDLNRFGSFDIPKHHLMIETSTQDQILSGRMPFDIIHATLMPVKIHFPLIGIAFQTFAWQIPNFHCSIVRTRGDLVLIERIKLQINNGPPMACNTWMINIDSTHLDQILNEDNEENEGD